MAKYAKADSQVLMERTARSTLCHSNASDTMMVLPAASIPRGLSAIRRAEATRLSSGVRNEALSTVEGRIKMQRIPTTAVKIPSMMMIHRQPDS